MENGYLEDGTPTKCSCGSTDLGQCNEFYDGPYILCEYDCRCNNCGKILNHWAYGHWEPIYEE